MPTKNDLFGLLTSSQSPYIEYLKVLTNSPSTSSVFIAEEILEHLSSDELAEALNSYIENYTFTNSDLKEHHSDGIDRIEEVHRQSYLTNLALSDQVSRLNSDWNKISLHAQKLIAERGSDNSKLKHGHQNTSKLHIVFHQDNELLKQFKEISESLELIPKGISIKDFQLVFRFEGSTDRKVISNPIKWIGDYYELLLLMNGLEEKRIISFTKKKKWATVVNCFVNKNGLPFSIIQISMARATKGHQPEQQKNINSVLEIFLR